MARKKEVTVEAGYLRLKQAAEYIGATPQFLIKQEKIGRGPTKIRFSQRAVFYPKADLDAWMRSRMVVQAGEATV